jgi:hypothetical protein
MRREIKARLAAAQLLKSAADQSDSAYLLDLLAFELLLKLFLEIESRSSAPAHHAYDNIFDSLPQPVQAKILRLAGERIGPSALTTDHLSVLRDMSSNFVNLRYPYERYSHMSENEYAEVGNKWSAAGAPIATAHFRYHQEELLGLIHALQALTHGC